MAALSFAPLPQASPAEAHNIPNVTLIAQASGKCLDIVGGNPSPGTPTHQWTCGGEPPYPGGVVPWQQWDIVSYDTTWHFILNRYSGLCLDVPGATPNDIQLHQWTCNYTDVQKFTASACAGCWSEMRNKASNKCVDVYGAGQANGVMILQTSCNGTAAQQWQAGLAYVVATTPFQGKWGSGDGYTDTRPWGHHIEECEPFTSGTYGAPAEFNGMNYCTNNPDQGQPEPSLNNGGHWSLDYYAPSNTQVKFYGLGVGAAGSNISARVWAKAPTCANDPNGASGGNTVFVDLHVYPNGQWYGWMSFAHLKEISVVPGQWISANQVLGKTDIWANAPDSCYAVCCENGVHTHIEMWNKYRYACFKDWGPLGIQLAYLTRLGDVGRAIYSAYRSPCVN